jgi:hypothetical protein
VLPPGKRYDVLVKWPRPGTHTLETLAVHHRPDGGQLPTAASYDGAGQGDRRSGCRLANLYGSAISALAEGPRDRTRHLVFSENTKTNSVLHQRQAVRRDPMSTSWPKLGTTEGVDHQEHGAARSIRSTFT